MTARGSKNSGLEKSKRKKMSSCLLGDSGLRVRAVHILPTATHKLLSHHCIHTQCPLTLTTKNTKCSYAPEERTKSVCERKK